MARRVFYSFHYDQDNWRASQVRNMGVIEGNRPATGNDWESVKRGGDKAIKNWIANQMRGRSCTVVLVGEETASRDWIKYEIIRSWNDGMGVVGIRIHGLQDYNGETSNRGHNPFDFLHFKNRGPFDFLYVKTGRRLSEFVKCYDPPGITSQERYGWIRKYLAGAVDEAIRLRERH